MSYILEANLFPDSPVREWDKLLLRGDFGGSWLHQNGTDALTAGSDASIPGLGPEQAATLRDRLARRGEARLAGL